MSLRDRMITAARMHPELRAHLIPLIRKLADTAMTGKGFENDDIRFHVYRGSVRVWDLTNAGKRGKKVDYFALYDTDMVGNEEIQTAIDQFTWRLKTLDYDKAKQQAMVLVAKARNLGSYSPKFKEYQEKGVRVTPAGFKPVKINGRHVYIESEYDSFVIRDKVDKNNLPTCIPAIKGGKKGVKMFYAWVQENESKVRNMTFNQILDAMASNGISYHQYCAMD